MSAHHKSNHRDQIKKWFICHFFLLHNAHTKTPINGMQIPIAQPAKKVSTK